MLRPRVQIVLIGTVWSLLSALCFWKWHAPVRGWIFGSLGTAFLVSGLFLPPVARAIHEGLKALTLGIVLVLSWILLGAAFFLLIMPLGWVLRRTGSLRTHRVKSATTYWTDRPEEPLAVERYLRPF